MKQVKATAKTKKNHALIANIKGPYDYQDTSKALEEVTKNTRAAAAALRKKSTAAKIAR